VIRPQNFTKVFGIRKLESLSCGVVCMMIVIRLAGWREGRTDRHTTIAKKYTYTDVIADAHSASRWA